MLRRIIMFVLAASLLLALVACGEEQTPSEAVSSEEPSVEESSEEPYVENEKLQAIKALLGEAPDRSLKAKNLFAGMKYTYSNDPGDKGGQLTDGKTFGMYDKNLFVALSGAGTTTVTFDLGEGEHHLADVGVDCLQKQSYGIYFPSRVALFVSEDGVTYTQIAAQLAPTDAGDSAKCVFSFALPGTIDARYIRVAISRTTAAYVDEIVGYEYCEDGNIDVAAGQLVSYDSDFNYYGYELNTEVTTPVSASDADFKTRQNLALLNGASVGVRSFDPIAPIYRPMNTPGEEIGKLIDGKKASSASYHDPAMVSFLRAAGRHIIVDLGNVMAVDQVNAEFLKYSSAGIRIPEYVLVSVSTDGTHWTTADEGKTGEYMKDGSGLYEFTRKFGKKLLARYVRFSFVTQYSYETSVEVNCTEFEVWGTKDTAGAVEATAPEGQTGGRYPTEDELGFKNLLWSCSGYLKDGNGFTYDNSLAYFAYLDEDGNIVDRLFDSVVLGGLFRLRTPSDCKPAVEEFVKEFNTKDSNLDAIDKISGTLLEKFGDGKKITVWINLICPNSDFACSDVDGDGKAENFKDVSDCLKFLKWQVDLHVKAFKEAGYQNIVLGGFYWNNESIYKSDYALQCETITAHNKYLHSIGLRSIWAPYFTAYGQWAWKDVGFDLAMLQPNYMFNFTDPTRLETTATIAFIHGMGIELEIEDYTGYEPVARYHEYLRAGLDYGYVDAVNALYQGSVPGALVKSRGGNEWTKTVYRDTYLFTSGQLDDTYDVPEAKDFSGFTDCEASGIAGKSATLSIGNWYGYHLRVLESPILEAFRINVDGTIQMLLPRNFRGDCKLVLDIFDDVGNHKTITATVHVTER